VAAPHRTLNFLVIFFIEQSTATSPAHISTISSVRGLGAGLVTAWADPDHDGESDVSGEAAF